MIIWNIETHRTTKGKSEDADVAILRRYMGVTAADRAKNVLNRERSDCGEG